MNVLIIGGLGFFGTYTTIELMKNNKNVILVDKMKGKKQKIEAIERIMDKRLKIYEGNVLDEKIINQVFLENSIDIVIDFVTMYNFSFSQTNPNKYYTDNMNKMNILLRYMKKYNCQKLIYASSAAVYGNASKFPIEETNELNPSNNYGRLKKNIEELLNNEYKKDKKWTFIKCRYFNPIGIYYDKYLSSKKKSNIYDILTQTDWNTNNQMKVCTGYSTKDGTAIRDYIHILDVAKANNKLVDFTMKNDGNYDFNIASGQGTSVKELINTFENITDIKVNVLYEKKCDRDIAISYANIEKIKSKTDWYPEKNIEDIFKDYKKYIIES